ncbi:helix-turn-helix transcriptional regulator [uncultured Oscillibacter sp.]|uniref:helix-turn-helix domain-containing protein n=1 Tax=uncultured Oscillibacter sp. TaxID=876091 RepID=UPI00345423E0
MAYDIKKSGARIRQLRIQGGYTQEKLAGVLNIDRSLLSHIEAGKRGCSVLRLFQCIVGSACLG